jgi:hypothetical protein
MHGPGPHKILPPEEYLENFGTSDAYNTKCVAFSDEGKCNLWGTAEFPLACRTHVCNVKIFTKKELDDIERVDEDRECPKCETPWMLGKWGDRKKTEWVDTCENCGHTHMWKKINLDKKSKKTSCQSNSFAV